MSLLPGAIYKTAERERAAPDISPAPPTDIAAVKDGAFADAHGDTKLGRAIERIRATWDATRNERSTQLVFCDLSTTHPGRFNVYEEVRSRLMAGGIPKHEIAFIPDADSDAAKLTPFNAVNAGRVRIVIGSTEKMGAPICGRPSKPRPASSSRP